MKLFVIIAIVVAWACAAPTVELLHPSPINPDVLVAVKPEEKIILITDPKEIEKFKRDTKKPLYPTILPKEHEHHLTARDHKSSHQKRDVTVPLIAKHYHPEESSKAKEKNSKSQTVKDQAQNSVTTESFQKLQTLPVILKNTVSGQLQHKRDIPVPLIPKHRHLDESSKEHNDKYSFESYYESQTIFPKHRYPEESSKHNYEKDFFENNTKSNLEPEVTAYKQEHVFKIGQQKPQILSAIPKETTDFTQHQKRETSIHLVSKPESSEDNKKIKSDNHQALQVPSDNFKSQVYHEPLSQEYNQYHGVQTYLDPNRKHLPVEVKENINSTEKSQAITINKDAHYTEGSKNESSDKYKEVKESTKEPSPPHLHGEYLSEPKPLQMLINHTLPIHEDHKPNDQGDHLSVRDVTTSASPPLQHPLLTHQPVPVAELFAGALGN